MFVLLTMIMVVAAFAIVVTLVMMIMEKSSDIAILKTMGASDAAIERIFAIEGTLIGLLGTGIGVVAGHRGDDAAPGAAADRAADRHRYAAGDIYQFSTLPWEIDRSRSPSSRNTRWCWRSARRCSPSATARSTRPKRIRYEYPWPRAPSRRSPAPRGSRGSARRSRRATARSRCCAGSTCASSGASASRSSASRRRQVDAPPPARTLDTRPPAHPVRGPRPLRQVARGPRALPQRAARLRVPVPPLAAPISAPPRRDAARVCSRARGLGDRAAARGILEEVGISERLDHRWASSRAAERQRVAVARALVLDPALVLADEPTGICARAPVRGVASLLLELDRTRGAALVVVTHSSSSRPSSAARRAPRRRAPRGGRRERRRRPRGEPLSRA